MEIEGQEEKQKEKKKKGKEYKKWKAGTRCEDSP
jgi:hypothetical protein